MVREKTIKTSVPTKEGSKLAFITFRSSSASDRHATKAQEEGKARAFWCSLYRPKQTGPSRESLHARRTNTSARDGAPKKLQRPSKPERDESNSSWSVDSRNKNKSSQTSKHNSTWYAPVAKRSQNDHSVHYTYINDNRRGVFFGGAKTREGNSGQKLGNTEKGSGESGVTSLIVPAATSASCLVM